MTTPPNVLLVLTDQHRADHVGFMPGSPVRTPTLDALADKLAQICLLVYFTLAPGPAFAPIPLWFLIVVLARDAALGAGWLVLRLRRGPVRVIHKAHGRLSSLLMFGILVWVTAAFYRPVLLPALWVAAALIVVSAARVERPSSSLGLLRV